MKFFIIHGAYGSPEENWFPWLRKKLEEQGHEVIVPTFPTPENQNLDMWMNVFGHFIKQIDQNTIFIGHSLGPAFILSILEKIDVQVRACFFVAGFTGLLENNTFDGINKTFVTKGFDWEKIEQNCKPYVKLSL